MSKADGVREHRVPIMMSARELKAVDDWRFQNRVATRSDAVRRLAYVAIDADIVLHDAAELAKNGLDSIGQSINKQAQFLRSLTSRKQKTLPVADTKEFISEIANETGRAFDLLEELFLILVRETNRATATIDAPSAQEGLRRAEVAIEETDKQLADFRRRLRESEENRLLLKVIANESVEDRAAYELLSETDKDAYLERRISEERSKVNEKNK